MIMIIMVKIIKNKEKNNSKEKIIKLKNKNKRIVC